MPTYVYCLLTASDEAPPATLRGVDDAPVRLLRAGAITGWVSDVAHVSPAPTVERARAHDDVVRQALGRQTPIPARFGQTFASDAALLEAIRARETVFVHALERVWGAVEMTVRVLPTQADRQAVPASPVAVTGMSGRDYLARVRERYVRERTWDQEADFLQRRVADAVRGLVRAEVRATPARPARSLSISHLVNHDRVPQYRASLTELADSCGERRIVVSGPWAPYSFAEIGGV